MRALANPRSVEDIGAIQQHVGSVAELASNSSRFDNGVEGGAIRGDGGGLEVLDELAHAHQLARGAELLLGGVEGRDAAEGPVRAVQVPGQEAREVLHRAEDLVAADWGRVRLG